LGVGGSEGREGREEEGEKRALGLARTNHGTGVACSKEG
jgi:hypothetical protein